MPPTGQGNSQSKYHDGWQDSFHFPWHLPKTRMEQSWFPDGLIEKKHVKNKNIKLYEVAFSDKNGEMNFYQSYKPNEIKTPEHDDKKSPVMHVLRSFDINKPGSKIANIKGGVIGGSLTEGQFNIGDEIEIKPGLLNDKKKN